MRQHRKQGKSIFQFIFAAMLIVLGIEVALLIGTLYFGNVGMQMNRNAIEILKKQVENRQNYLRWKKPRIFHPWQERSILLSRIRLQWRISV